MTSDASLPCVLLRGLTREARHWGGFPDQLRGALPGVPVIALDLPGNGRLHAQRSPRDVATMAEHCSASLREQGWAPPYRLVAMSLGAMVAVAWADAQPEALDAAVLINTSLRGHSAFWQRLRPSAYPTLLRLAFTDPATDPDVWERAVLKMTSRLQAADPASAAALQQQWTAWRRDCPVSRTNALRQLVAAARYRAPARAPAVPMQALVGARDALVSPRCSHRLARAWGLPIAEHPRAGHDLPLDDGPWVAAQVARFFAAREAEREAKREAAREAAREAG